MITFYSLYTICICTIITYCICNFKCLTFNKEKREVKFEEKYFLHHIFDFLILVRGQSEMVGHLVKTST